MFSTPMCYGSIANLKELQKTCSMHQEEWSKRDFGGDYQPATGEAEQITQTRHGA